MNMTRYIILAGKRFGYMLAALVLAIGAVSCGGGDSFTVVASVDGLGTQNVKAVYRYNGRIVVIPALALDGKFRFQGASDQPVLIDLYTGTRTLIGSLVAVNGETVEVTYVLNEPGRMTAKGNDISAQIAKFCNANAELLASGDVAALNDAVTKYVSDNPAKKASPYILLTMFTPSVNPELADSLLSIISANVKLPNDIVSGYRETLSLHNDSTELFSPIRLYTMPGDSLRTIEPRSGKGVLLALTPGGMRDSRDTLLSVLNAACDTLRKKASVVEVSFAQDTTEWRNQSSQGSPRYVRCWTPAAAAWPGIAELDARSLPWYISVDTTSIVIYRGPDLRKAVNVFE